jgi:hypothetical protein
MARRSRIPTKQFAAEKSTVGYVYQQITGDSGSDAKLGPFVSRVIGIGRQTQLSGMQDYVNVKGYGDVGAHVRWRSTSPAIPTRVDGYRRPLHKHASARRRFHATAGAEHSAGLRSPVIPMSIYIFAHTLTPFIAASPEFPRKYLCPRPALIDPTRAEFRVNRAILALGE